MTLSIGSIIISNPFDERFTVMANVVYEAPPVYKRTWFIVVMLIYVFPVGLFLMWKYTNWKQWVKIAVSVVIAIIWLSMIPACYGADETISELGENISSISEDVSSVTETTTSTEVKIEIPTGAIVKEQDGIWGLYLGNNLVDNYTGIASNENGDWYINQERFRLWVLLKLYLIH